MQPPKGSTIVDTPWSTYWTEPDGLLCSVTKQGAQLDIPGIVKVFDTIQAVSNGKKVCWLADVTHVPSIDKESREYAAAHGPRLIHAVAALTDSTFSKMLAELFLVAQKPAFPVKIFKDEQAARKWLRQFLNTRPQIS